MPRLAPLKDAAVEDAAAHRPALEFAHVVDVDGDRTLVAVPTRGSVSVPARRLDGVSVLEAGDEVVVAFVGEASTAVIVGRVVDSTAPARDVRVNGRRVTLEADSELVLQCASATITIRRDGSVAVRGERVTSQARGRNRIRGSSVELN